MKMFKTVLVAVLFPIVSLASESAPATLQILNKPYRFFRANSGYHLQNGQLVGFGGLNFKKPYCTVTASSKRMNFKLPGTLTLTTSTESEKTVHRASFTFEGTHDFLEVNCISFGEELLLENMNEALGDLAKVTLR